MNNIVVGPVFAIKKLALEKQMHKELSEHHEPMTILNFDT